MVGVYLRVFAKYLFQVQKGLVYVEIEVVVGRPLIISTRLSSGDCLLQAMGIIPFDIGFADAEPPKYCENNSFSTIAVVNQVVVNVSQPL